MGCSAKRCAHPVFQTAAIICRRGPYRALAQLGGSKGKVDLDGAWSRGCGTVGRWEVRVGGGCAGGECSEPCWLP